MLNAETIVSNRAYPKNEPEPRGTGPYPPGAGTEPVPVSERDVRVDTV